MKQLGDITKLDGSRTPLVDVIVGGSPCQDLSTAGKRVGLCGERSSLFTEQIRVIKEMREAAKESGLNKPRYTVWENVSGIFTSNNGEDFRFVLEETAKIADDTVIIRKPECGRWTFAGAICGDNWSIAWRTMDAQYWGVPQRRRRVALVADFAGATAGEVLFEHSAPHEISFEHANETRGVKGGQNAFVAGVVTKGDGTAYIAKERHTALTGGGGQAGQGYPCVLIVRNGTDAARRGELQTVLRKLTPAECCSLQGYPHDWCNIGDWCSALGKEHKSTDMPKYRALGNSLALPQWYFVLSGIA